MSRDWKLSEATSLDEGQFEQLSVLLIDVVADGASIGFLPPVNGEEALQYWKGVLEPGVLMWVAAMDGRICGTVQLQLARKANAAHRAEVCKLMVHPSARRHGIARALMQTAERRAVEESRSLLVLDTREGDPSNLLYRSLGYIEAGRIPNFARSAEGRLDTTVLYYKTI
jgi:ribosomal protein S18 acetylase RimI-like enzyme